MDTATSTNSPTDTPADTPTNTATGTPADTPTVTDTPTATDTATVTDTPADTGTATDTPTDTPVSTLVSSPPGWVPGPSLPTGRLEFAMTADDQGNLYLIGGDTSNGDWWSSRVDIYDSAGNTWTMGTPMPYGRFDASAVYSTGKIYVMCGGQSEGGGGTFSPTTRVDIYDVASDTWTQGADMPLGESGCAAVAGPDGLIYAMGGGDQYVSMMGWPSSDAQAYNPATDTWTVLASLPYPSGGSQAVVGKDGNIYLPGGMDNNSEAVSTFQMYSPSSQTWTVLQASLPNAVDDAGVAAGADGRIYVVSGVYFDWNQCCGANAYNTVQAYDPRYPLSTWSGAASLPDVRYGGKAVTLPDGQILVAGGYASG